MAARIAVDAMGGDHAPRAIVRGAVQALGDRNDLVIVLVGREEVIQAELKEIGFAGDRLEIVHASQVVEMDEPATDALRQKKDSSVMAARRAHLAAEKAFDRIAAPWAYCAVRSSIPPFDPVDCNGFHPPSNPKH